MSQLVFVAIYTVLTFPALGGVAYWLHCKQSNSRPKGWRMSRRQIVGKTELEWPGLVAELKSGRTHERDAFDFFAEDGGL